MSRGRFVPVYITIILAFSVITVRLCYLAYGAGVSGIISAASGQYSSKMSLASRRGFIYDRNGEVIAGVPDGYLTVFRSSGIPQRKLTDIPYNSQNAYSIPYYKRYHDDYPAVHLIGYLDGEGKSGLTGIEKYYNDYLLSSGGSIYLTYRANAKNGLMWNYPLFFHSRGYNCQAGLTLTIDLELQRMVETLAIPKGAVVVADSNTGEVIASASFPSYDPSDIAAYLDSENGEFINRVTSSFTPGSVFKIITACALLEENKEYADITVECTGERCYGGIPHGKVDMPMAFAQSCNQYFIELERMLEPDTLVKMTDIFGIGYDYYMDFLYCGKGTFSDGARSNTVIGQGGTLITPIELTRVMCAVVNGGRLPDLSCVKAFVNYDGTSDIITVSEPYKRVISKSTAETVKNMLKLVIDEGIGKEAMPSYGDVYGGKTASAQSGQYNEDGSEIIHSWFCGYYGDYVITALCEDITYGTAASVFAETADLIAQILN